jgi:cell shape-determining protein MreD
MRYFYLLVGTALLIGLQSTLFRGLGFVPYSIDVALVVTVYCSATSGFLAGFYCSIAVGLIEDMLTPGALIGLNMEIMGLLFFFVYALSKRMNVLRPLVLSVVVLLLSLCKGFLVFIFGILFVKDPMSLPTTLRFSLPQMLTTSLLSPLLALALSLVDRHRKDHSIRTLR